MGGKIDWHAMPVLVELYGIDDVECFIAMLDAIRIHLELKEKFLSGK